jgi:uncharacterized membrane protein YccC
VQRDRVGLWLVLIAMILTLLGQAATGFNRPVNVIIGCLCAAVALFAAAALRRRRHRDTRRGAGR